MNSRQLQYVIQLAKVRNFSQVAEQLDISQPALSKQVMNLERELGIQLFNRDTSPLAVTPAGEHFVREAQELLYKEDQLMKSMERFRSGEEGRLVIGVSPFRSLYLMPQVVKKVRERFPGVCVQLCEVGSGQLRKDVAEGKYDFAVVNLPVDELALDVYPIETDTLVLAVPQALMDRLPGAGDGKVSIADCRELPFITVSKTQEMRKLFDRLCQKAGFSPDITVEVTGIATAWAMVQEAIGATLLPMQFVNDQVFGTGVTLLKVNDSVSTRQPAVVTRRGQYLSEYAKYAIGLLTRGE